MNNFNLKAEIQKWINEKKLVQIHHSEHSQDFDVAYIFHLDNDYITFADLGTHGIYGGITICHLDEVNLFKTESIYLSQFAKKIKNDNIYQKALATLSKINKFTPEGLFISLRGEKDIVGLQYITGEDFGGRIVDFDEKTLILDEYNCENAQSFARTYLIIDKIVKIKLAADWLNTISQALFDYDE